MGKTLEEIEADRARIGISIKDLCIRADVSQSTISRARTSGRAPSRRILRKLERALGELAQERLEAIRNLQEGEQ